MVDPVSSQLQMHGAVIFFEDIRDSKLKPLSPRALPSKREFLFPHPAQWPTDSWTN